MPTSMSAASPFTMCASLAVTVVASFLFLSVQDKLMVITTYRSMSCWSAPTPLTLIVVAPSKISWSGLCLRKNPRSWSDSAIGVEADAYWRCAEPYCSQGFGIVPARNGMTAMSVAAVASAIWFLKRTYARTMFWRKILPVLPQLYTKKVSPAPAPLVYVIVS